MAALGIFARFPSIWTAILLLFILYAAADGAARDVRWAPLKQRHPTAIDGATFSPWLASHHIQAFTMRCPIVWNRCRA